MKTFPLKLVPIALAMTGLTGCSALYYNVSDPGASEIAPDILKSIRCEVVSFLSINYQNALSFAQLRQAGRIAEAIALFPYSNIDRYRFAGLEVRLLDTNNFSAGSDVTNRVASIRPGSDNFHSLFFGPSLGLTTSYGRVQAYALPQHAELGPLQAGDELDQIYAPYPASDAPYFCYKPLPNRPSSRAERLADLDRLVAGQSQGSESFTRIRIAGGTLAQWLQRIAAESALNNLASVPNREGVLTGQLSYSFAIELKPALNIGYTLVAVPLNPFNPTAKADLSNKSTFTLWLNQKDVVKAYGGQSGAVEIDQAQKRFIRQTP